MLPNYGKFREIESTSGTRSFIDTRHGADIFEYLPTFHAPLIAGETDETFSSKRGRPWCGSKDAENRDDLSRARCSSAKRRIPLLKRIVLVDGEELVNRANEVEKKPEIEERRKTAIHFYRFDYPKYECFTFFSLRAIVVDWRSLKVFRRHSTPRLDIRTRFQRIMSTCAKR